MNTEAEVPKLGFTPRGLYIGGKWTASSSGKTFETVNPSTMEGIGQLPAAIEEDVDRAVQAAKTAFRDWGRTSIKERAAALTRLADRIMADAGYVWINSSGRLGSWKQSGIGREECFDELLSYTQVKNINMRW